MFKWNSETWRKRGKYFCLEIKHWVSDFIETRHNWNVYAYIYPKHPAFNEIKENKLFIDHEIQNYFHWGLTFNKWHKEGDKIISKQLGSDYKHLDDNYHRCSRLEQTPCEEDAMRLFDYLEERNNIGMETSKEDEEHEVKK